MTKMWAARAVSVATLTAIAQAAAVADPCVAATSSLWVSAQVAHACELNVPYNQSRSQFVIDNTIKATPFYTLENWFLNSPNPLIPHNVNLNSILTGIQSRVRGRGYKTDWDFNAAVTNAFNLEQDGHTIWDAACTTAFSWNHPFSVANWASDPFNPLSLPHVVVNYDLPLQGRAGLEAYYQSLGFNLRQYDGFQILAINGQEANFYLTKLAQDSSTFDGLFGSYETLEPRYMRLMSRYSADTTSGAFTQETGRFASRPLYPGANSIKFVLQGNGTIVNVNVPWAATFIGSGTDTPSFIANTCLVPPGPATASTGQVPNIGGQRAVNEKVAVVPPDSGWRAWSAPQSVKQIPGQFIQALRAPLRWGLPGFGSTGGSGAGQPVTPTLKSFGTKVDTIDIYQLQQHPHVGVVYMEQFEPSNGLDFESYINGVSEALYTGLTELKAAGVKHILLDQSGNRGGYIYAGAIALWSFWPNDIYPGFPAVLRDLDLARRLSDTAAAQQDVNSEYFYGNYRDLNYNLFTSNSQFMDPPVPQTVNGVADAYSKQFFDDFGNGSSTVTNFTAPPFASKDIVMVANSICASTCSIFSSYMYQKHNVRSAVFGGPIGSFFGSFDGGVKGSEVSNYASLLAELQLNGLASDPEAPQPMPIQLSYTFNFRNAIPYIDKQDGILEYVYEPGTTKYSFTRSTYNNPQAVWEFTAGQYFGNN